MRKRFIDMSDYGSAARVYWWTTTLVGALALGGAVVEALNLDGQSGLRVAALMAIVFVAGLRPIRIPGTITSITPGDLFIFLAALFWGPAAATLVAATDAITASYRTSRRWTSRLCSPALMAISAMVSASAFEISRAWLLEHQLLSSAALLWTLLLFSLMYFALNSLLTAALYALKRRERLIPLWWSNYSWATLTSLASASAAGLIYLSISQYGLSSLLAAGPLVGIVFATCHFYFKQADERARASERVSRVHLSTVEALATAIDAKDQITHDHVFRVQVYATGLAQLFGLSQPEIEALKAGALLHDVGKIAVPDHILNKPGKLTAAEFEKMKIHTVVGAEIMERINFPYPVVPIVRHHHERWDGSGYPDGLKGNLIPLTARILTVVDVFDALREDRQYRRGLSREEACQFLKDNSGRQFDPQVVDAFLENLSRYEEQIAAHKESLEPLLTPTTQPGLSESARRAVPAAGLAPAVSQTPDYVKQIHAARTEVAALYEMAQNFNASLDVRDVVTLTVNRIELLIPFTTCVVYLRQNDDSARAVFAFGKNAELIRGTSLGPGRGIAGWVLINGRPMCNADPMLDLADAILDDGGYRAATVYPLTEGNETIGALAVYTAELDSYDSDQLRLLESISRLTSNALQHARLCEQAKASAQTDELTGLPNSRGLYARFDEEVAAANQLGEPLVVLLLSLSGLRSVNNAFGYQAGDRVLAEVSSLLRLAFGESSFLARIAGNEFICLLRGYTQTSLAGLIRQAEEAVSQCAPEVKPGQHARVKLAIASAHYPVDGLTVDELLQAAALGLRGGVYVAGPTDVAEQNNQACLVS